MVCCFSLKKSRKLGRIWAAVGTADMAGKESVDGSGMTPKVKAGFVFARQVKSPSD
jgi:hypothetical protein